jgi:pentose-5-phosphate-3-epimerase
MHNDYIVGHHHTLLKINSENSTLLHQDVQDIHRVINLTLVINVIKMQNTKRKG